jgi:hypothetical protein
MILYISYRNSTNYKQASKSKKFSDLEIQPGFRKKSGRMPQKFSNMAGFEIRYIASSQGHMKISYLLFKCLICPFIHTVWLRKVCGRYSMSNIELLANKRSDTLWKLKIYVGWSEKCVWQFQN